MACFVLLIGLVGPATARAESALAVAQSLDGIPLGRKLAIVEDDSGKLTLQDVSASEFAARFIPSRVDAPAFGFKKSTFWVRFDVDNQKAHDSSWLLELAYPHLDWVDLFVPRGDGSFEQRRTGDHLPFAQRDVEYRNFVFTLTEPKASHRTYYLRLRTSGAMNIPLVAWTATEFHRHQNRELPLLWMFYGLMLVMACYNAFIFVSVREVDYLYYCLYVVSYALFQLTLNGFTFQYLFPKDVWIANHILPLAIALSFVWAALFLYTYMSLRETMPMVGKVLRVGIAVMAVLAVYALFGDYVNSIRLLVPVGIILVGAVFVGGIVLVRRGHRPAKFFLLAWSFFLTGILLYFGKTIGILPNHFFTNWGLQIGASLEVAMLSFALADRINVMRANLTSLNTQLSTNVSDLQAALARAEQATLAKSQFLATVSHELRTPLNAIINIPQGLLEEFKQLHTARCSGCESLFGIEAGEQVDADTPCPECKRLGALSFDSEYCYVGRPERTARYLGYIERSGKHLLQVINGVLDFSRLGANKLELQRQKVSIATLLREVGELLTELARNKGVGLVFDMPSEEELIEADPLRLNQVLINLIGNAIKFSDGKGTVRVGVRSEADAYVFYVRDQGIGIAREHLDKMFRSFEQVHKGDTRKYGGTGLGLSISHSLVELHGGAIWVESELGHGSTFLFRIPRVAPSAAPDSTSAGASAPDASPRDQTRSTSAPPLSAPSE